jgi:hypothetical protein
MRFLFAIGCLLLTTGVLATEPDPACFDDDLFKEPARTLVGRLVEQKAARGKRADPFFTLELDEGVCLNGAWRESVTRDIRSVQVLSQDGSKSSLLERYRGRRVEIGFEYVFEPRLSHHHRSMVGSVKTVAPL